MPKGFFSIFSQVFPIFQSLSWPLAQLYFEKISIMNLKTLLNTRTYKIFQQVSKTRKSNFGYTCSITTPDNIGATNSRRALSKTIHFYSFETKSKGKDTSEWRLAGKSQNLISSSRLSRQCISKQNIYN